MKKHHKLNDKKDCLVYISVYKNFKKRQNYSTLLEIKTIAPLEWKVTRCKDSFMFYFFIWMLFIQKWAMSLNGTTFWIFIIFQEKLFLK